MRLRFPPHSPLLFVICFVCDSLVLASTGSTTRGRLMEGQASLSLLVPAFTTPVGVCTSIGCPVRLPAILSCRSHIPSLDSETCCHVHTSPHSLWRSKLYNTSLSRDSHGRLVGCQESLSICYTPIYCTLLSFRCTQELCFIPNLQFSMTSHYQKAS